MQLSNYSTANVLLLPSLWLCWLAAISHKTPTALIAVSGHSESWPSIYSLGTDSTVNMFHYRMFSRCRGSTVHSCCQAMNVVLSPVFISLTWQWVYMLPKLSDCFRNRDSSVVITTWYLGFSMPFHIQRPLLRATGSTQLRDYNCGATWMKE
jgi:hypothetical protein